MKKKINSIRGIHDYFPEELTIWKKIEKTLKEVLNSYCYQEIRLPILEPTSIFKRTIGNVTDILKKEMYSFSDKKGNSLSLRPEGTVGCVRAIIQKGISCIKNKRFWYLGPMFRYERPQSGRYRQFYQLGGEVFGCDKLDIDLEIVLLTFRLWKKLGIENYVKLEINTIGSLNDRVKYEKELVLFLKKYEYLLNQESKERLYTNPFRLLDTKDMHLKRILKKAPLLKNYINDISRSNFNKLLKMIKLHDIKYIYNQKLVRGLDYYNDTVFEWKTNENKSQNTICAGGRYDTLVEKLGENKTSAIGFAIGIERLALLIKSLNIFSDKIENVNIYIIFIGDLNKNYSVNLSEKIRNVYPKLKIFVDFSNCNLSKKIKNAVSFLARIVILIGSNEIEKKCILIKDLKNKTEDYISEKELMLKIKTFFKNA